ncbi:MAG: hypothetical protein KDA84_12890, partial [Planctomycetaceae bacterium]|nr:hypothetical protein [Planctomycetaceae bacterium]
MLARVLTTITLLTIVSTPALAEDAPPETSIQLYKVADLVSSGSLSETFGAQISATEWQGLPP